MIPPAGSVHVWTASLIADPERRQRWARLLNEDERRRADRYRFARHRERFIAARAILRTLVGTYIGVAPGDVRFGYGPFEKPFVAGPLRFNASDSSDFAAFAFARDREVGIDLERLRRKQNARQLAERFFASSEAEAIAAAPESDRERWFFACWTRKEAYVKARGEGLSLSLKQFAVKCDPAAEFPWLRGAEGWTLRSLDLSSEYASALCTEGSDRLQVVRRAFL